MRLCSTMRSLSRWGTALWVVALATSVGAQATVRPQAGGATGSRIQTKSYEFKGAGKAMDYALFVPSSYDKDKKAPLIVALHGLGGNPQQMIRSGGLTAQAEKYGYIVVAPMGYNSGGWYGAQGPGRGMSRPGGGFAAPGTIMSRRTQETLKLTDDQKKKMESIQQNADEQVRQLLTEEQNKQYKALKETAGRGFGGNQDAPANLGELSEKDVMNVLAEVRKAFNIDEKRIYLIGHSMGGAGTYHLGAKYAELWAGLAPIAAAAGPPRDPDRFKSIPVIVVHGDNDTTVSVEGARRCVDVLKEHKIEHEYLEIPGAGHGDVVGKGMPAIFAFFEKHAGRTSAAEGK